MDAPDDGPGLPDAVLRYADHDDGLVDVHLPAGATRPRPLVFYVHGGFWRQRWDRTHARPLAEALAARGYVVALPEYRRVGGEGGWPTTALDVEAALEATPRLLAGAGVTTTSTILVGHSAGGHLVLWLANQPHAIDRVVALAPVGDLRSAADRGLGAGATQELLGGSPQEVPDAYDAADPASRLDTRPTADLVVVHGDRDEDVPVDLSRGLVARHPWIGYRELAGVTHSDVIDPLSAAWPAVLAAIEERA
jgi:acetyl esterase/lipase